MSDPVEPVITLYVRAYDLGIPSLDSEVPVNIFTQDVTSRIIKVIIPGSVDRVRERRSEISSLVSTFTGGDAEIQDVQAYEGQKIDTHGVLNINSRKRRLDEPEGEK